MNLLNKLFSWYFSKNALPYWCVLLMDSAVILWANIFAVYLGAGGAWLTGHFWQYTVLTVLAMPLMWVFMRFFHTYSGIFRYSSFIDLVRVAATVVCGEFACSLVIWGTEYTGIVNGQYAGLWRLRFLFSSCIIAIITMWLVRIMVKYLYDSMSSGHLTRKVIIYGVKEGGVALAKSIRNEHPAKFQLKGFVSPYGEYEGRFLQGVHVFGNNDDVMNAVEKYGVQDMFVSPMVVDSFRNNEDLVNRLTKARIRILMPQGMEKWDLKSQFSHQQLHEVDIEDLLPRDQIQVDLVKIGELLSGRKILITGAAGSIGSEMVRQVAQFNPALLILIDQAETPMHDVRLYMAKNHPEIECLTIVGSITNQTHMEEIFRDNKPEYVFHAAAYKHVPMMEDNPAMAVQNNVYGTRVIADLAVKYGTRKFVMISTDKAVNPTNVMGCSKRICEIYCQSLNSHQKTTQFITTRFGNVLGSNGSVIPIFREQIKKGGPLTVTHPDIIRFFMLIPEACQLVLEAGTMGNGGEIFVFDMGKPVRIADLAQRMIDLSGAKNVEIKFTGLRDGEKLYEEVLNDAEQTKPTTHPKIKVAAVCEYPYEEALRNEKELYDLSFTYDDMTIVQKMKQIVPEYKSKQSKYEVLD